MITLRRPIVTEKSVQKYTENSKVTFEVDRNANKIQAAKAVEDIYGVTVLKAWTINRLGKKREDRKARKLVTKTPDMKIMVFQLKEGDKIDIFESK